MPSVSNTHRAVFEGALQDLRTTPALVDLCFGAPEGFDDVRRGVFLETTTGREVAASDVRGIALIAPDADLACILARLSDVVGTLHAHQRVHLHAQRLLDAQSHLTGQVGI